MPVTERKCEMCPRRFSGRTDRRFCDKTCTKRAERAEKSKETK